MKQINVSKILMYVFIMFFLIGSLGGITIYLIENNQLLFISKVIITSIGSSILSIGGFFISFLNYNNGRRDKLEKEQKERFEKYDEDIRKYKKEKEDIKKEVEKKFAELRTLVNAERKRTFREEFKANEMGKKLVELANDDKTNREEYICLINEYLAKDLDKYEEGIDLNDKIIDRILEILSGKEDNINIDKPELKGIIT